MACFSVLKDDCYIERVLISRFIRPISVVKFSSRQREYINATGI